MKSKCKLLVNYNGVVILQGITLEERLNYVIFVTNMLMGTFMLFYHVVMLLARTALTGLKWNGRNALFVGLILTQRSKYFND